MSPRHPRSRLAELWGLLLHVFSALAGGLKHDLLPQPPVLDVQDGKWLQLHHSELVKLGVQEVTCGIPFESAI